MGAPFTALSLKSYLGQPCGIPDKNYTVNPGLATVIGKAH